MLFEFESRANREFVKPYISYMGARGSIIIHFCKQEILLLDKDANRLSGILIWYEVKQTFKNVYIRCMGVMENIDPIVHSFSTRPHYFCKNSSTLFHEDFLQINCHFWYKVCVVDNEILIFNIW